jgi:hypothetical protein
MCIPLRLSFVYLAKTYTNYLPLIGILSSIAVIGWISNFYFNTRTKGILGQEVWWNNMRPVHIFLYAVFTILAFNKNKSAWVVGLLDVIIGIVAFLLFHLVVKPEKTKVQSRVMTYDMLENGIMA